MRTRTLGTQDKIASGIFAAAVAALVIASFFAFSGGDGDKPERVPKSEVPSTVVRDDSHRLDTTPGEKVTLVEFLDFECEACAAAYPFVEQLRQQYQGKVTFVLRYFPIPSHRNANNAAYAVEAAARQDQLEPMYQRMYQTQAEWGESNESKSALFRSYAEDLGLDMGRYDKDVASDSVKKRVQKDVDDGTALGVSGTPTFFLNGEKLQPESTQDFTDAIDQALLE